MTEQDEMEMKETLRHMIAISNNLLDRIKDIEQLVGTLEWKIKVMSGAI